MMSLRSAILFHLSLQNSISKAENYFRFFIFSIQHLSAFGGFDVGRSMFDVHIFP